MSDDVLELLEDDETLAQIAEEIRAKRVASGLNPDTGGPTERERIEMCGPDPVRNEELGL